MSHPRAPIRALLDALDQMPGASAVQLADATGTADLDTLKRTLRRYERAGHVSTDEIDGVRCYWLERPTAPTLQDRILAALTDRPATWGEIQAVIGRTGMSAAMQVLERDGRIVVEQRTATRADGRTVARPSLYRLA